MLNNVCTVHEGNTERDNWKVCGFMKIEKMIHLSLIERNIHVIHVTWFLCFLARLADLKESFKNKEMRWIKWDPNINAKQKSTLQLLNNQDPPYWPLQNCKKFYIGYTCLLHGPSNFQQMVSGISLFKNTNISRYL